MHNPPDATQFAKNNGSEGRPKPTRESLSMWHSESDSNLSFRHGLATAVSSKRTQKVANIAKHCRLRAVKLPLQTVKGQLLAGKRQLRTVKGQLRAVNRKLWAIIANFGQ